MLRDNSAAHVVLLAFISATLLTSIQAQSGCSVANPSAAVLAPLAQVVFFTVTNKHRRCGTAISNIVDLAQAKPLLCGY